MRIVGCVQPMIEVRTNSVDGGEILLRSSRHADDTMLEIRFRFDRKERSKIWTT